MSVVSGEGMPSPYNGVYIIVINRNLVHMKDVNLMLYAMLGLFTAAIVGLDQWTKYLSVLYRDTLALEEIHILGLFRLSYTENSGAAWSMLEGQTWFFLLVLVAFIAILGVMIWKKWLSKKFELICMAAILGGALGNAADRVFRGGKVIDMIEFDFWQSFPTFNVADCFITLGCAALVVYVLFFDKSKTTQQENEDTPPAS